MADLRKQGESEDSKEKEKSKASTADELRAPLAADKDTARLKTTKGGDHWVPNTEKPHPSRRLEMRTGGYGIAAGYEKPYRRPKGDEKKDKDESYGPIPHSGYYGAGEALRPFKFGQAGFDNELEWYRNQYGKETSGFAKKK